MNAVITVVGEDKVGIIAAVSSFLAERQVNIIDISQTILSGRFVMMMTVDAAQATASIDELRSELNGLGERLAVLITIMHEEVFSAMHRI